MFFCNDLYAGLYRRQAGMKCRHRITVCFGRGIGEPITTTAGVEACTQEDDHDRQ